MTSCVCVPHREASLFHQERDMISRALEMLVFDALDQSPGLNLRMFK